MMKLAVLVSGRGSNLQALIDACQSDDFPAEIVLVLSNKADAYGLERAKKAGIPTAVLSHKDFNDRESFDAAMSEKIEEAGAELVCLAGFMRLLSDGFVRQWRDRLINIHPSLLPAYKGLHVHERMIEEGARFGGCTVHYVRPAMDEGPIIIQAAVPIHPDDTPDDLAARILEQEHVIYPAAVKAIAEGKVRVRAETVDVEGHDIPTGALVNPAL